MEKVKDNTFAETQSSPVKFKLLLEFPPFDVKKKLGVTNSSTFTTGYIDHICRVRIFSQVGVEAIKNGEIQEFNVKVPFGFTLLGAADENLKERIDKLKKEVDTGFFGTIGTLEDIFRWLNRVAGLIRLVADGIAVWNTGEIVFGTATAPVEAVPVVGEATTAQKIAICLGNNLGKQAISKTVQWMQVPLKILTCERITCVEFPGSKVKCDGSALESLETFSYPGYVQSVLDLYNEYGSRANVAFLTKEKIFPAATSVYENIYLSTVSLCLPGIIHNLDKYRQIKCRTISCLQNDVPQGKATITACTELEDVMTCKYFAGPFAQLIPVAQVWDGLVRNVQTWITDSIAFATSAAIVTCAGFCLTGGKGAQVQLSAACVNVHFVIKLLSFVESTIGAYKDWANAFEGSPDYCSQVI